MRDLVLLVLWFSVSGLVLFGLILEEKQRHKQLNRS